jgi:hypothetical protein
LKKQLQICGEIKLTILGLFTKIVIKLFLSTMTTRHPGRPFQPSLIFVRKAGDRAAELTHKLGFKSLLGTSISLLRAVIETGG